MDLSLNGAQILDQADPLKTYRKEFYIPKKADGTDTIYLTGNSLGLQPKNTRGAVLEVLDDWEQYGVEGHFKANRPWMPYHEFLTESMAQIVGARTSEVVVMNSLTVNLHLLMASFYRPKGKRRKIVIEQHAFPSDRYAVRSQIDWHGFDSNNDLIIATSADGGAILEESTLEKILQDQGDEIALVLIGGVNYYTGQFFDLPRLAKATHAAGAFFGVDLAHAAGNVALSLHDWDIDFAAWCSYKYLNAGPGGPSGVFVHDRHGVVEPYGDPSPLEDPSSASHSSGSHTPLPRLSGWWGHHTHSRFAMPNEYVPMAGAEGWQLSNPSILAMAGLRGSLEVFAKVGMPALVEKSRSLTQYMEQQILSRCGDWVEIITPSEPSRRGAQLSVRIKPENRPATLAQASPSSGKSASRPATLAQAPLSSGKTVFHKLEEAGVICDWREPDTIRLAPVPLYNTYEDAYWFAVELERALQ